MAVASWTDVVLAVAITGLGQYELRVSNQPGWHGLGEALLLLAQTAPVAARRTVPAGAAAVAGIATALEAVLTQPTNTLAGLIAPLILVFGLGRYVTGRRLIAVTSLVGVSLILHICLLGGGLVDNLAFAVIFAGTAWLVGRTLRRRELERERILAEHGAVRAAADAERQRAVIEERNRIARELHDIVAHGMGVMVVQAAAAEQLLDSDPASAREPLTTVRQTGQGALAEMRRLLGLLRTGDDNPHAEPQPGLDQLESLVDGLRQAGVPVTLTITGSPLALSPGLQLCAYRIVQEALTNAFKHAQGASATVAVTYEPHGLALQITNGAGDPLTGTPRDGGGHGLVGMRERVLIYGGSLRAEPQPDGSFLVEAMLPWPARSERG